MAVLHLRPSRLAIIVPPWEFGPVLTSYRTHYRTSNSPQTAPIVGSRFSDRAHYNEFVESKTKSWVMMRRDCFGDERHTESGGPIVPGRMDLLERECANPLSITQEPSSCFWASLLFLHPLIFRWSLLLFSPLFRSSSSYTCQSFMPIFKCTSHQPFFLTLCELLWPPLPCLGVISTSKGVRVLVVRI